MSAECAVLHKALESEAPTPVFLPGESQGQGSLMGCHLWGCTESDTTEATYQQHGINYHLNRNVVFSYTY